MYLNAICDTPCHVFKIPVTYKIRQTDSDFIFLHARPEIMSCFGCKLFCNKDIFSDYLFILWNSHHACLWKYFFPTYLRLNNIKKKRVATQFCTQHFFFFHFYINIIKIYCLGVINFKQPCKIKQVYESRVIWNKLLW